MRALFIVLLNILKAMKADPADLGGFQLYMEITWLIFIKQKIKLCDPFKGQWGKALSSKCQAHAQRAQDMTQL